MSEEVDLVRDFACPLCKGELQAREVSLQCLECETSYQVDGGIPCFVTSQKMSNFEEAESEFHTCIALEADDAHGQETIRSKSAHHRMHEALTSSLKPDAILLDIACGTGTDVLELARAGYNISAIDISLGMLRRTQEKVEKEGLGEQVSLSIGTARRLPFFDNQFNGTLICAALHHMETPEVVLREMVRVTSPGGVIVIGMEPNSFIYLFRRLKHSRLGRKLLGMFRKDYTLEIGPPGDMTTNGFSLRDWYRLATSCDLEVVSVQPLWYFQGFASLFKLNDMPLWMDQLLIILDRLISRMPFVKHLSWKWLVKGRPINR